MNIRNIWISICFFLFLGSVPAFAVDQSICSEGSTVSMYDSGMLKSCNLKANYDGNGITCQNDYEILFYGTGELQSCILYREFTINGVRCRPEGLVSFYRDGSLRECVKSSD